MTIKQKFSSIDQSKLTADQKSFLDKIKNVTKNFTDAEMNKKVETPLDNFIAKAKEKMPEAIKSAPVKRTAKAKASKTRKPKRTAMSLAKEIRKEGESWSEARARASKMMKEDSKDLSKTVETELDKLSKLVKSQKDKQKLVGISGTDIKRDSVRKAKPRGARTVTRSGETSNKYGTFKNHLGRKYYENRDKHSDRLAPNYPKNAPLLAEGGSVDNSIIDELWRGYASAILFTETDMDSGEPLDSEFSIYDFNKESEANSKKMLSQYYSKYKDAIKESELDLETVGMDIWYTQSGQGAGFFDHSLDQEVEDKLTKGAEEFGKFPSTETYRGKVIIRGGKSYAEGGYLTDPTFGTFQNQVLAEGGDVDAFTLRMVKSNGMQPAEVLKEDANVKYAGGGFFSSGRPKSALMRDRKNVNHSEDYEVRYSKPRPSRSGYSGNRRFELGGSVVTDLAGHTGGSLGGDPSLLSGTSGTAYTGLVGETGAMSSGEMFMAGGNLDSKDFIKNKKYFNSVEGGIYTFSNEDESGRLHFKDSKNIDRIFSSKKMYEVKSKFELGGGLPQGVSQSYMVTEAFGNPAQHYGNGGGLPAGAEQSYINYYLGEGSAQGIYSKGGSVTNERKHVNKDEDYEVRYAKPRPSRKGYKGVRGFATGGGVEGSYYVFSNKRNEIIADGFKTENEAKDFMYNYYQRNGDFSLSIKKYNKGGALTNERKHVNHDEDYEVRYAKPRASRKGYKGARKFMSGGSMETPRIYVADLEAYNNGRLVGEWLDLADYNDADELMEAIQDVLKKSGGEEYAIHDVEYVPRSMYSEYMGKRDFEELYEMMDLAKDNNLPLEVVQEVVSQYDASAVDEFQGKYDNAEDFAEQLVDEMGGLENFSSPEYYVYITDTDRRLLAGDMADSYVEDIRDEDGGNRVIEEAGLSVDEYEESDNETQDEMLDKAVEIVRDEYYDTWYEGLSDPYYFLVDEQGIYSPEDFFNASFISVDYEKLARDLEQDYTFIEHDGELYVFNIR